LLANISELMKKTDWHTIDKYILDDANEREPDESSKHLKGMVDEYENFLK